MVSDMNVERMNWVSIGIPWFFAGVGCDRFANCIGKTLIFRRRGMGVSAGFGSCWISISGGK
jgi:hypothetical protein